MPESVQEVVGVCGICQASIVVDMRQAELGADPGVLVRDAVEDHLAEHSPAEVAGFHLRATVPLLPATARDRAARALAAAIRRGAGEDDRDGVYSVADVLGDVEVYRLWMDADRCHAPDCRHAA